MGHAVLLLGVLLTLLLGAAFLLGRHLSRRQFLRDELSPVSRQHIDLIQGGHLSEALVEATKAHFRDLLERGDVEAVEASLRPGMQYVVQVRALAELGTDDAGSILERQLQRRLTDDQLEQSWYWIDLASGLRALNRPQSLPHLLRRAETACEIPLGHFFAAETVCFLGFAGYLNEDPRSPLRRAALRVLHRALEGLRAGVPPQVVIEGRIGEMVETLWDSRDEALDPLVVRIFHESLRVLRRTPYAEAVLGGESSELEAFRWQTSRLAALEPMLSDYLQEVPGPLCRRLLTADSMELRDCLLALLDLRAESATHVLPLLGQGRFPMPELAIELLTWSSDSRVGPWLREWTASRVPMTRRAQRRRRGFPPSRPSVSEVPYREVLRALRGHPSEATESFLLLACRDWDPVYRCAALSSLGWWEPMQRAAVLAALQEGRRDISPEVRQCARAALARLGERQALQWFRQTLASEDPHRVVETIHLAAQEGLTLLWPDLDRLAESEDSDLAHHAREALERMSEEFDRHRI